MKTQTRYPKVQCCPLKRSCLHAACSGTQAMLPALGHLVSVQIHLDLTPAEASQEYVLDWCPHPFTQTRVFN